MRRKLFTLAAAVSLVLCAAAAGLWAGSYRAVPVPARGGGAVGREQWFRTSAGAGPGPGRPVHGRDAGGARQAVPGSQVRRGRRWAT